MLLISGLLESNSTSLPFKMAIEVNRNTITQNNTSNPKPQNPRDNQGAALT